MGQLSRSELRKQIMTILYQINIYDNNKMKYNVDDIIKEVSKLENEFVKDTVYGVITYKNDIKNRRIVEYFCSKFNKFFGLNI